MSDIALSAEHVWKKFSRGERHDTLRDLFPALAKRFFSKNIYNGINSNNLIKDEFWVLQDISFEIKKGETVGIIGHNGAGKSTMLKHLNGIMQPTRGNLMVNGRLSALIEVGAGFHPDLTGRENIYLNGIILGMTRQRVKDKFDEIVEFSGLADFIDTPVKRYSSGMFARLGFSVAAHLEPDILVIDEVLSVGDYAFQTKGVEKMKSVARSGATVIFVSHNLVAVSSFCSRTLLLRQGRLEKDGPTSEVISAYMQGLITTQRDISQKEVVIDEVVIRGKDGPKHDFESGEHAWMDISVRALRNVNKMSVGIHALDDRFSMAFNTNSARLGLPELNLKAGEVINVTYQLTMHLAAGTFHFGATLYRFDIERLLDGVESAVRVLIRTPMDVRGVANLYPSVTFSDIYKK